MLLNVLICRANGAQELVAREMPEDYRSFETPANPSSELEARISRLESVSNTLSGKLLSIERTN